MITQAEEKILNGICESSKAALLDIHTILGKVYNDELALDLNLQAAKYSRIEEQAANSLLDKGVVPEAIGFAKKTKRWAYLQANTVLNVSTTHIANIIIQEKKERLEKVRQTVQENPVIHNMVCELAEEFMDFEADSIRILKSYL